MKPIYWIAIALVAFGLYYKSGIDYRERLEAELTHQPKDYKLESVRSMFSHYKSEKKDTLTIGKDSLVVFRVVADTIINVKNIK